MRENIPERWLAEGWESARGSLANTQVMSNFCRSLIGWKRMDQSWICDDQCNQQIFIWNRVPNKIQPIKRLLWWRRIRKEYCLEELFICQRNNLFFDRNWKIKTSRSCRRSAHSGIFFISIRTDHTESTLFKARFRLLIGHIWALIWLAKNVFENLYKKNWWWRIWRSFTSCIWI